MRRGRTEAKTEEEEGNVAEREADRSDLKARRERLLLGCSMASCSLPYVIGPAHSAPSPAPSLRARACKQCPPRR